MAQVNFVFFAGLEMIDRGVVFQSMHLPTETHCRTLNVVLQSALLRPDGPHAKELL